MNDDVLAPDDPAPDDPPADGGGNADFATALLRALNDMAVRSQRRQADVMAAMRGAGLDLEPQQVQAALRRLQEDGCVNNLVPLSDGGLLLTVTPRGMEHYEVQTLWLPVDEHILGSRQPPAPAAGAGHAPQDYRDFFENAIEGIYRSSLSGQQLKANPALVRLNGYETEEEMLRGVRDIGAEWYVEPGRREEFCRLLREHGRVENFVSEIYRHRTRERIWISENARLVRDSLTGEALYFEGTVRELHVTDDPGAAVRRA